MGGALDAGEFIGPCGWFDPEADKRPDPVALRAMRQAQMAEDAEVAVYRARPILALLRITVSAPALIAGGVR